MPSRAVSTITSISEIKNIVESIDASCEFGYDRLRTISFYDHTDQQGSVMLRNACPYISKELNHKVSMITFSTIPHVKMGHIGHVHRVIVDISNIMGLIKSGGVYINTKSTHANIPIYIFLAMKLGVPVITVPIKTWEGILVHEHNCLITNDKQEMGRLVKRVIEDDAFREQITTNAKELVDKLASDITYAPVRKETKPKVKKEEQVVEVSNKPIQVRINNKTTHTCHNNIIEVLSYVGVVETNTPSLVIDIEDNNVVINKDVSISNTYTDLVNNKNKYNFWIRPHIPIIPIASTKPADGRVRIYHALGSNDIREDCIYLTKLLKSNNATILYYSDPRLLQWIDVDLNRCIYMQWDHGCSIFNALQLIVNRIDIVSMGLEVRDSAQLYRDMLLFGSCGIVPVMPKGHKDIDLFIEECDGGIVCSTPVEWFTSLQSLCLNKTAREVYKNVIKNHIEVHYNIDIVSREWQGVFNRMEKII